MGVAFDALAGSHTGITGSTSEASFNWTHTPVGTPKGVLVYVMGDGDAADIISGVTYGGDALSPVTGGFAQDTDQEPGFCKAYFLGAGISTGAQTVEVTRTNNSTEVWACSVTVTAGDDTDYTGVTLEEESQELTEENIDDGSPGESSLRVIGAHYGHGGISSGDMGANTTFGAKIDYGSTGAAVGYETTPGQGSRPVGFVKVFDDFAAVYLAIIESSAYTPPTGVTFDASSESHTGTTSSTNEASFSWTHTPAGTPKGATVYVVGAGDATDIISSVTYGGTAVPAVTGGLAQDTVGEPGFCKVFHLGSSVPTGAQSVVVNRTNNATEVWACCVTVTAGGDTSYTGVAVEENDQIPTEEDIDDGSPGGPSLRLAGGHAGMSGISNPEEIGANSTLLHDIDYGSYNAVVVRETTTGQGARPVGLDKPWSDDLAFVYLAIIEPGGTAPTVDAGGPYSGEVDTAISLNATVTPGSDPSLDYLWEIVSGGTGTFSDAAAEDPTFTPDSIGSYTLRLTVSSSDSADVVDTCVLDSTDTAGAWVITNGTAALDEVGLEGVADTASTLTATSANCTAIATAVTMASGTHTGRFFLKRLTGTGNVDISVDGGSTWETVTLTGSFQAFIREQSSLANPSLGIRIVTSGDEVAVGNTELYLNMTEAEITGIEHIYTYANVVTAYREAPVEQMGEWTASTGWTAMPGNSRYWPLNEESGDVLDEANN